MTDTETLEAYALDNYEAGGHWIVETFGPADYQAIVDAAGGNMAKAKTALKKEWLFMNMRESEAGDY
jgi:hypothetical protein